MTDGFDIRLRAALWREEETEIWVARCTTLDVASQGRTPEEAKTALTSAVVMFLTACWERKVLDNILVDAGFCLLGRDEAKARGADGTDAGEFIRVPTETSPRPQEAYQMTVPMVLLQQGHC